MKILGGAKRREKKDLLLPQSDEDDGMGVLKPIEILWKSQKKGEVGSLPLSSSTRLLQARDEPRSELEASDPRCDDALTSSSSLYTSLWRGTGRWGTGGMEREELSRFQLILHEFLSLEGTLEAAAFQMSFHWDHFMVSNEFFVEPKENEARMHSEILLVRPC
ncbi:uncharacterized protein LOC108951480 isoform X1 [Musa acuminata AAA Group]|uniref:uncharacterized protein LOC108951480 isoform X1 n=2 Tax=Musa acuminata AAA Group TaxID=214697 RepID=UPI0031E06840